MVFRTPFFLPWLYPGLIWRMSAREKIVYLTFDDGPVPGPTEFVLDVLKQQQLKATFFCIGDNIRKHPGIFQRTITEGHVIGNHTFNHLNGWKTEDADYLANTELFNQAVTKINPALRTHLFRPPYGRITRRQIRLLQQYQIIMWDVLTHDYHHIVSPERCLRNSLKAVRNGSIVVFHDSVKAERNLQFVLPRFIEACQQKGYTFSKLA
ncbi:MAG: polysaccharide deacetylase family protein [Flammeovirgaceae bacterium]|nr:MAG: polysaccharide deacetylase family protein [Flammeovirgaceae bacterium]